METESFWSGPFGREYTDRNQVKPEDRLPFWRSVLEYCTPAAVLEVGCNRGHNLQAIQMVDTTIDCAGMDINEQAVNEARAGGVEAYVGSALELTTRFGHGTRDLVFSCGVLIHIPPDDLERVMRQIVEVSARYVLAVEYESDVKGGEEIEYRGHKGKLWRRPFGQLYMDLGCTLISEVPNAEGFDHCTAWLLTKPGARVIDRNELF